MKSIALSKNQFSKLAKLDLPREVFNTESIVYDFSYKRENKVLKKLHTTEGVEFANKLYTLQMLEDNKENLPSNFYIPDYLCSVHNEVIGFTIPKAKGINLATVLKDKKSDTKEQLYYLKKVGDVLSQLQKIRQYTPLKDFYINDLHESNIIVNKESLDISFVDIDSCKIGFNASSPARFLLPSYLLANVAKKYKFNDEGNGKGFVIADENSDLFCYNMIILNYLSGVNVSNMTMEEYYSYLNYLDSINVNKDLLDSFERLVINRDNINPADMLETITYEQTFKAKINNKEKTYSKNKKIG